MGHPLCYIPPSESGWRVVEVTARTVRGTLLLRPSSALRDRVYGVIGRAQRKTGVRIHAFTYLSNHHHILLSVRDAEQLADFLHRIQPQVTIELRDLIGWRGPAWAGRCKRTLHTHEAAHLTRRLCYVLEQGCKEGLVKSPGAWPGPSSTRALCEGTFTLDGTWFDRSNEARATSDRGAPASSRESVVLSKLPGFEHFDDRRYSEWVQGLVSEITTVTRERHRREGTRPMGVWNVLRVSPLRVPKKVAWGPRKRVQGSSRKQERHLLAAYAAVVAEYSAAAERLLESEPSVRFPEGTFARSRGFCRAGPTRAVPQAS